MSKRKRTLAAVRRTPPTAGAKGKTKAPRLRSLSGAVLFPLALSALLFAAPLFRGLYFEQEQLIAYLCGAGLTAWFLVSTRGKGWPTTVRWTEYLAAGIVLSYIVAIVPAVNPRAAVRETLAMSLQVLVYLVALGWVCSGFATPEAAQQGIVRRLGLDGPEGRARWLLKTVVASVFTVTLVGLLVAAGWVTYPDAVLYGRLAGTIQYPNTYGAVAAMAFVLAITLWATSASRWRGAVYGPAAYTLAAGVLLSFSRGGWLVAGALLIAFIALWPGNRGHLGLRIAAGGVAVLALGPLLVKALRADPSPQGLLFWALGALLAGAAGSGADHLIETLPARRLERLLGVLAVLGAGGAAAIWFLGYLPAEVIDRLRTISFGDESVLARYLWTMDALKIVRDYPVFGAGGGAWASLFPVYQSYDYWTTQVHNDFAELWAEVGTVGLAVFVGFWTSLAVSVLRRPSLQTTSGRMITVGAAVGIMVVLGHSLIDFDFALLSVGLQLWSLAGVVRGLVAEDVPDDVERRSVASRTTARRTLLSWAAVTAALAGAFLLARVSADQAVALARQGDVTGATRRMATAIRLDPLSAGYRADQARFLGASATASSSPGDLQRALALAMAAVRLEPFKADYHDLAGALFLQMGLIDQGLAALERALSLNPYYMARYEQMARAYSLVGIHYASQGQADAALGVFTRLAEVPTLIQRRREAVPAVVPEHLRLQPTTPELELYLGQAHLALGNLPEAQGHLQSAAQAGPTDAIRGLAHLLLAVLHATQGEWEESKGALAAATDILAPEVELQFEQFRSLFPIVRRSSGD